MNSELVARKKKVTIDYFITGSLKEKIVFISNYVLVDL